MQREQLRLLHTRVQLTLPRGNDLPIESRLLLQRVAPRSVHLQAKMDFRLALGLRSYEGDFEETLVATQNYFVEQELEAKNKCTKRARINCQYRRKVD